MNLKPITNFVTSKVGRQLLHVQKHSPAILLAAGVVGVVGATVLACKATLNLDEILEKHSDAEDVIDTATGISEDEAKKIKVALYIRTAARIGKLYAPAVGLGLVSIAALTTSHVVLNRRHLAVTAAYAALDKGFRQYRDRVIKELGIEKDREFRYGTETREIVEETEEGPVVKTVKQVGPEGASVYAVFFDEGNRHWSRRWADNSLFLRCQQDWANDRLRAQGHLFLNEVYDMLGIDRTPAGAIVGWVVGAGDNYVDFGVFSNDLEAGRRFVNGEERSILLDFNVDGPIWDKIGKK